MLRDSEGRPTAETDPSRRAVLELGGGVGGTDLGPGARGASGVRNWLTVRFRGEREVWLVVGRDLEDGPRAAVQVVVAEDGVLDCHRLEVRPGNATPLSDEYDEFDVVPHEVGPGETILGLVLYDEVPGGDSRFDRPRCLVRNDTLDPSATAASLEGAGCVRAAVADHWRGRVEECRGTVTDAVGDDLQRLATLVPADGTPGAAFGQAVAVDHTGTVVVVGAPGASGPRGTDCGAAYVFTGHGGRFVQTAKLATEDGEANDRFGVDVALNAAGDTALVGQRRADTGGTDGAYVFERSRSRWVQTARLRPPASGERGLFDGFGHSVALDAAGDTALIGTLRSDGPASNAGSALVAKRRGNGWTEPVPLSHGGGQSAPFGDAVTLASSGTVGAVGARNPRSADDSTVSGCVHVHRQSGGDWKRTTALQTTESATPDRFGTAVACDAGCKTIVAGRAGVERGSQSDRGGVVTFRWTPKGWTRDATFDRPEGARDSFGRSVALNETGQIALVGAPPRDTDAGSDRGSAYLYAHDGSEWHRRAQVGADGAPSDGPTDRSPGDCFGFAVDLDALGRTAVVGAHRAGDGDTGAAYVFERA